MLFIQIELLMIKKSMVEKKKNNCFYEFDGRKKSQESKSKKKTFHNIYLKNSFIFLSHFLVFWFFSHSKHYCFKYFFFFFILERISINGNYNYFHSGIYFQYCFRDTSLNFYHCVWKNETPKPLFQNSYLNHCGHHHGIVNSNRFINLCSL